MKRIPRPSDRFLEFPLFAAVHPINDDNNGQDSNKWGQDGLELRHDQQRFRYLVVVPFIHFIYAVRNRRCSGLVVVDVDADCDVVAS